MTAQLLAFPQPAPADDGQALLAAAVELHALISVDPVMGASPVRVYFVFNPEAKQRIAAAVDGPTRPPIAPPTAYAVVAYDFAFALHLIEIAGRLADRERARTIASSSAGLQGDALRAAAAALGVEATPVASFDAAALKQAFFAQTQETVTHLFRLELQPAGHRIRQEPQAMQP